MNRNKEILLNGLIKENPTFVQLLGLCPTLAVTTGVLNGLGMGLSVTVVLILSNAAISLMRKIIPAQIRLALFVVIMASFVTTIDMLLSAYLPSVSKSLGIFIPLIVVNCIIFARAEAFAFKNGVWASVLDALGAGLGFTAALCIISAVREVLGSGTLLGMSVTGASYKPVLMAALPPGGFIILGFILGIVNMIRKRRKANA